MPVPLRKGGMIGGGMPVPRTTGGRGEMIGMPVPQTTGGTEEVPIGQGGTAVLRRGRGTRVPRCGGGSAARGRGVPGGGARRRRRTGTRGGDGAGATTAARPRARRAG